MSDDSKFKFLYAPSGEAYIQLPMSKEQTKRVILAINILITSGLLNGQEIGAGLQLMRMLGVPKKEGK